MKTIKRLKNKGFTLVETIVAIAVFAVMTSIVLMILSFAIREQKKSQEAEANLNTMVKNVVEDDSARKYGTDSHTLIMKVDGTADNFSMTYNAFDGFRSYVKCPHCNYMDNNIEFMGELLSDTSYIAKVDALKAEGRNPEKLSHYFDLIGYKYTCPSCDLPFLQGSLDLQCQACLNETNTNFVFDLTIGSYVCKNCQSTNVKQKSIAKEMAADSPFTVSNMRSNDIRYGTVTKFDSTKLNDMAYMDAAANKTFDMGIKYTPNATSSLPGKYTLNISNMHIDTGEAASLTLKLPPSYICTVTKKTVNLDGDTSAGHGTVSTSGDVTDPDNPTTLVVSNITKTGVGSSFQIEFTLRNYINNNSFDYDYENKTDTSQNGLAGYWFQYATVASSGNESTQSYPRS